MWIISYRVLNIKQRCWHWKAVKLASYWSRNSLPFKPLPQHFISNTQNLTHEVLWKRISCIKSCVCMIVHLHLIACIWLCASWRNHTNTQTAPLLCQTISSSCVQYWLIHFFCICSPIFPALLLAQPIVIILMMTDLCIDQAHVE